MRACRRPRCSRYLATVRRAILSPRAESRSTIRLSDSGRLSFSAATISWIICLTARAETSSPSSLSRPAEKKYFNANTPRGVCTYFCLVTRDTVDSCMSMALATCCSVSGLRAIGPSSKKSRWCATIASMTLIMVRRRCSMVLMIHSA